jgi:hypothetical protein
MLADGDERGIMKNPLPVDICGRLRMLPVRDFRRSIHADERLRRYAAQPIMTSILDMRRCRQGQPIRVEVKRRFLGLMAVGDEAGEQMDEEVHRAAMAGVLDLADVLELVVDGLDERALAQGEPVGEIHQDIAHVLAQFRDEADTAVEEEALGEGLGDVALVTKEFAKEATDQAGHGTPVVGIAWGEAESEHLPAVVDDEMELEPVEPAHGGLATPRIDAKDAMLLDARVVADHQGGRVDEADARALSQLCVQVDGERYEETRHEVDEAGVTDQLRELSAQVGLHVLGIEPFEGAISRLLKEDENRHDLCRMQPCRASAASLP